MVLVALGVLIIVVSSIYQVNKGYLKCPSSFSGLGMMIFIVLGVFIIGVGLILPIHGYHKSELVGEAPLEEVLPNTGIYVIESSGGYKTFKYIKNSDGVKKSSIITNLDSQIIKTNNEKRPVIRKYILKPKTSIFTFALIGEREVYKIFVTQDCIEK